MHSSMWPRSLYIGTTIDTRGRASPATRRTVPSPAARTDHGPERAADDAQVEPQPLVAQVEELVLHLLERVGLGSRIAVLHLRPAGKAGLHEVADLVERQLGHELLDVLRLLGAGTDDAEVTAQDVQHLRYFVEVRHAQHLAEARDTRV